jgi:hypothetical protein
MHSISWYRRATLLLQLIQSTLAVRMQLTRSCQRGAAAFYHQAVPFNPLASKALYQTVDADTLPSDASSSSRFRQMPGAALLACTRFGSLAS